MREKFATRLRCTEKNLNFEGNPIKRKKTDFSASCYAPAWIRTMDPLIKSQLLYQLSYWCVGPFYHKDCGLRVKGLGWVN